MNVHCTWTEVGQAVGLLILILVAGGMVLPFCGPCPRR